MNKLQKLDEVIRLCESLKVELALNESTRPPSLNPTPWMRIARQLQGVKEIPGEASHPLIVEMQRLTRYEEPHGDDTPWCAAYVGYCLQEAGYEHTHSAAARSYLQYGVECDPCPGCVMVFSRGAGGHVGFYVGEDEHSYHILGGNQDNQVMVKPVDVDRFLAARMPVRRAA